MLGWNSINQTYATGVGKVTVHLFGHDIQDIAGFGTDIGLVEIEKSTFFVADANNWGGKAYPGTVPGATWRSFWTLGACAPN